MGGILYRDYMGYYMGFVTKKSQKGEMEDTPIYGKIKHVPSHQPENVIPVNMTYPVIRVSGCIRQSGHCYGSRPNHREIPWTCSPDPQKGSFRSLFGLFELIPTSCSCSVVEHLPPNSELPCIVWTPVGMPLERGTQVLVAASSIKR